MQKFSRVFVALGALSLLGACAADGPPRPVVYAPAPTIYYAPPPPPVYYAPGVIVVPGGGCCYRGGWRR